MGTSKGCHRVMTKENSMNWYHGKLPREAAETLLLNSGLQDGCFLVRESGSSSGDFVLSVLYHGSVCHFQIRKHTEDAIFSIEESIKIHGLDSLVDYYMEPKNEILAGLSLTESIKGDPPPHYSRRLGKTNLLHRATNEGNLKIVTELLKSGYHHEAKNKDGQTAVHLAAIKGMNDILMSLIEYGANTNSRDSAGHTPLHYACISNLPSTVRLLVQQGGANIQARNTNTSNVPLHEAAIHGCLAAIQELLTLNAPVNPRGINDELPVTLARRAGFMECVKVLEQYRPPEPRACESQWYHGTLSRNEAETLIRQQSTGDGTFLVRWSNRNKKKILTLIFEDELYNFIIQEQDSYLFIDNGPYLNSLEHIVDYYSFISDGLPTMLRYPVRPMPKPPVPECSSIPRPDKLDIASPSGSLSLNSSPHSISDSYDGSLGYLPPIIPPKSTGFDTARTGDGQIKDSIPISRLALGSLIGSGEFGSVYKGTYMTKSGNTVEVAIKTLRSDQATVNRDAFIDEANIMMKLDHPYIVKLIGLSLTKPLMMVQELVSLGSMLEYLRTHKAQLSVDVELTTWAKQIACGMCYLEKQRFVHRDLAARNILLASQVHVKISDFGLSRALGTDHEYYKSTEGGRWPLKWYAPESYNYGTFSHKSDVWSFGVVVWEIFSWGALPYGHLQGAQSIELVEKGYRLEQPEDCPKFIYNLILRCWLREASERPTFMEIYQLFSNNFSPTC